MSDQSEMAFHDGLIDPDSLSPADLYRLGESFFLGLGGPRNLHLAVRWFKQAADRGHWDAKKRLEKIIPDEIDWDNFEEEAVVVKLTEFDEEEFKTSRGNPNRDQMEVFDWHGRQAAQGDPAAQFRLGFFLEEGVYGPKDPDAALQWYLKSADQGYAPAQFAISTLYSSGLGVERSEFIAFQWMYKAAVKGNATAQYHLGRRYDQGDGVEEDKAEAGRWYRRSAEQGHVWAQYFLGHYLSYDSDPRDWDEAFIWYHRAAEQGDANAMESLSLCYGLGLGVSEDHDQARIWSHKAAQCGSSNACLDRMSDLFLGQNSSSKDEIEAMGYFYKSAKKSEMMAVSRLRSALLERWTKTIEM